MPPFAQLKCTASNQLVLIVDDENPNREALRKILAMSGLTHHHGGQRN